MKKKQSMPAAEPSGFVATLNNMGYMTSTPDPFSRKFVSFAKHAPLPVLDIGAAYGVATRAALGEGATVIANDLDPRHLEILEDQVSAEEAKRLRLLPGRFPDALNVEANSVGAILIARVLHFLDGDELQTGASLLHRWLSPGGQVFVVAETPYLKNLQKFIPIYEKRKTEGAVWPGLVENVPEILGERAKLLPTKMMFLDPEVLSRVFSAAGFSINEASMFARKDFPEDLQLDGRESVGLVGTKS